MAIFEIFQQGGITHLIEKIKKYCEDNIKNIGPFAFEIDDQGDLQQIVANIDEHLDFNLAESGDLYLNVDEGNKIFVGHVKGDPGSDANVEPIDNAAIDALFN